MTGIHEETFGYFFIYNFLIFFILLKIMKI